MRLPIQQPKASSLAPKPRKTPRELALLPAHRALAHLPREAPHPEPCLSLQRSPTRSTPSPAPPPTARRSPTTWTSPTHRAPTCCTSWPSTPRSPPSRSSCARWPPRRARARWACPRRPECQPPGPATPRAAWAPGPLAVSPMSVPPGAVPEVGAGGPAAHPGHPAGLPVPAAPHRPPVRAAAPSAGPLLLHRLILQGGGSGPPP